MHAEIVSIGTEILMGEIVDTNSGYLASALAAIGVELRWVSKVGDDPDRLSDVLRRAWQRSDVTITTGGLGPTSDDLTRETIAGVLGEKMTVQDDLLEHLRGLFAGRGAPMPATNVKQATLIPSADAVSNPVGTAPGWWVERDGRMIAALPGPPRELERMWVDEIAPRLRERNRGVAIATRTLKTFGISEGGLDEMISPLFQSENPSLGIYSREDGIHLRAIARAISEEEAGRLIAPMEARIRETVGEAIWGQDDDTPATQAASLLLERRHSLGILEVYTGGMLVSALAEVAGSRDFLKGSVVPGTNGALADHGVSAGALERHGAVSPEAAVAMATAARDRFGAHVGVAVTGLATEPGAHGEPIDTCYLGYALADGETHWTSGHYPARRLRGRSRASTQALLGLAHLLRLGHLPDRRDGR